MRPAGVVPVAKSCRCGLMQPGFSANPTEAVAATRQSATSIAAAISEKSCFPRTAENYPTTVLGSMPPLDRLLGLSMSDIANRDVRRLTSLWILGREELGPRLGDPWPPSATSSSFGRQPKSLASPTRSATRRAMTSTQRSSQADAGTTWTMEIC